MAGASQKRHVFLATSTLFFVVLLVAKAGFIFLWGAGVVNLRTPPSGPLHSDDVPRTWFRHTAPPVQMQVLANTVHYKMDGPDADLEWEALTPYNGIIHLDEGDGSKPYSVAMFHQLRCLDVIRQGIAERRASMGTSEMPYLTHHCVNYLRQITLCDGDLHLDPALGTGNNVHPDVRACRDWTVVYEELEKNHRTQE